MLLIEAAQAVRQSFRGVAPVVFQNHFLQAMREFCRDSRIVLRTIVEQVPTSSLTMTAAPSGASIMGLIHLSGEKSGSFNVGLSAIAGEQPQPKVTFSGSKISFFKPVEEAQQVKAIVSLQPNRIDPWIPEELVTGEWFEAVYFLTCQKLSEDLTISQFDPREAVNWMRQYRGMLSSARIEASNLGGQQMHRVPQIHLEGVGMPNVIAAPVPESELDNFDNDFGSVTEAIDSAVDFGGNL